MLALLNVVEDRAKQIVVHAKPILCKVFCKLSATKML